MTPYGTITRIHGQSSFGSAGGIDAKMDDGKTIYLAGSYYRPTRPVNVTVGGRIELLEHGRYWTVHSIAEEKMAELHPDSHPEPPEPSPGQGTVPPFSPVPGAPIPRIPRERKIPVQIREGEPTFPELMLLALQGTSAQLTRTNELLEKILIALEERPST